MTMERAIWIGLVRAMEENGTSIGDECLTIARDGAFLVFSSRYISTERVPYWCDGKPVHRAARNRQAKRLDDTCSAYRRKIMQQLAEDIGSDARGQAWLAEHGLSA